MRFAKTIKIFLIDGDPNGRMSCELSNWSGKAYKIPRIKVKECSDRADLINTGVYLLFGKDEEGKDQVYIGEAESILKRLNQNLIQKDFWNEAIVFISKDDNLNKAHIKYLENRLFDFARITNRYKIENSNTPTQSSLSESDKAEMEEFIENIKMMVNTLGHKVFEEKREFKAKRKQESFFIKAARGADGQGEPTSEGFLVFKGSKAAGTITPSMGTNLIQMRDKLIEDEILFDKGEYLEFTDDSIFSSPLPPLVLLWAGQQTDSQNGKRKTGQP